MEGLTTALALRLVPGIREHHRRQLRAAGIQPSDTATLTEADLASAGWPRKLVLRFLHACRHTDSVPAIKRVLGQVSAGGMIVVAWTDPAYPQELHDVLTDPPPVLFARGNTDLLRRAQLAIVGSRRPNPATHRLIHSWARHLADSGVIITSGLAYGIDVAAHSGALLSDHGHTIAVLAGGIDHIYPPPHYSVVEKIVASDGLVVTEQLPETRPRAGHFPRRNRLVAGLARATLVGEAAHRSGSLITAGLTADQGKPVMVVPDHPSNGQSHGGLQLLRDGAEPVADWVDCLAHFPERPTPADSSVSSDRPSLPELSDYLKSVACSLSTVPESLESLANSTDLSATELLPGLLKLELMGLVTRRQGGFQLVDTNVAE